MISIQEALNIVLSSPIETKTERINFHEALNRVLAEELTSDVNFPPFDKSAMDGFAICESDLDNTLNIVETIAAGQMPSKTIKPGLAAKIMTGAPIPKGADFVIQVELSETINDNNVRFTGKSKNNIIYKASETKVGDTVLHKGQVIDERHIAILASIGCDQPLVYKKPTIGIISTGDEIIEPSEKPSGAQIRNSNGHQLIAQVLKSNATPIYYGIIPDTPQETLKAIEEGINECDMLLITGGVSMGEFDFVPKIMEALGVKIHFDSIAIKPGKPTTFGTKGKKVIFGLPGNPVSSFFQFDNLVKPLIYKMMNAEFKFQTTQLIMGETFTRKKADRLAQTPVEIKNNKVYISKYKGSSHLHALSNCQGFIEIKKGESMIREGDQVDVRLF